MVLKEDRYRGNFSLVRCGLQARPRFLQRRQPALLAAEGRDKPADVGIVGWNDMDERLSHHLKAGRANNLTFVRIFWCFHAAVSSIGATAHYLRRWPMVSIFLWSISSTPDGLHTLAPRCREREPSTSSAFESKSRSRTSLSIPLLMTRSGHSVQGPQAEFGVAFEFSNTYFGAWDEPSPP